MYILKLNMAEFVNLTVLLTARHKTFMRRKRTAITDNAGQVTERLIVKLKESSDRWIEEIS